MFTFSSFEYGVGVTHSFLYVVVLCASDMTCTILQHYSSYYIERVRVFFTSSIVIANRLSSTRKASIGRPSHLEERDFLIGGVGGGILYMHVGDILAF